MLAVGEPAPDFTLTDPDGNPVTLSEYRGERAVVLVFYPGDGTPLCTAQLCEVRDAWADFQAAGVAALGINPFSRASKARFTRRHGFPFPLLADPGQRVGHLYGAAFGLGALAVPLRTVYGIGRDGRIAFARRGKPAPMEVLRALGAGPETQEAAGHPTASSNGPDGT